MVLTRPEGDRAQVQLCIDTTQSESAGGTVGAMGMLRSDARPATYSCTSHSAVVHNNCMYQTGKFGSRTDLWMY